MCTMAFFAPSIASNVLFNICGRIWLKTWIVTSSGMRFSSINVRMNENSVSDAAGKPTSISLNPSFTRYEKKYSFSSGRHRRDERLISVAKVHTAPDGSVRDLFFRPVSFKGRNGKISAPVM